mgnify:CR=1 FL=1
MSLVPYVVEQTSRGERSYDIYSRLLKDRPPAKRNAPMLAAMPIQIVLTSHFKYCMVS